MPSISQEQPPQDIDDSLRSYLSRRFISIGNALNRTHEFVERKQPPPKPQTGDIYYFGDPLTHNYDPAITSEGWWGMKSTGWVLIA